MKKRRRRRRRRKKAKVKWVYTNEAKWRRAPPPSSRYRSTISLFLSL